MLLIFHLLTEESLIVYLVKVMFIQIHQHKVYDILQYIIFYRFALYLNITYNKYT